MLTKEKVSLRVTVIFGMYIHICRNIAHCLSPCTKKSPEQRPPRLPTIPDLKCLALIPSFLFLYNFPFPVLFGVGCFLPWPFYRRVACIPRPSNFTGGIYDHRYLGWAPKTAVCLFLPGGSSFPIPPPRSSIISYFLFLLSTHNISVKPGCCFQPKNEKKTPGQVTLFSEILPAHARNRVVLPTPGGPRRSIAFSSPMRSCWESHVPLKQIHELGT